MKSPSSTSLRRIAIALSFAMLAMATQGRAEAVRVPGTRISLEAPADFIPSTEFQGFEKRDQGASIQVTEIGVPFASYRGTFSREALEARSLYLAESGRWSIDGLDGLLLRVSDASGSRAFEAWILVFGDGGQSTLIVGTYPREYATHLGPAIRRSVLTATRDPGVEIGTFEGLPFEVEETRTIKIATRMSDAVILTPQGVPGRVNPEDAFLVARAISGPFDFGNFESASREHLEKTGLLSDVTNLRGTLASVDGMTGYELTARARDARDGTPLVVYQMIVGEGQRQFQILGLVGESQASKFLPEFETVARSLRRTR
jgi:hypothetical protein